MLMAHGTAIAQLIGEERPERPSRALFGSGIGPTEQQLVLTADVGVGLDYLDVPGADPEEGTVASRRTLFSSAVASLRYDLSRERFTLGLGAQSAMRAEPEMNWRSVSSHSGDVASSLQLSTRTAVTGNVAASYEPLSVLSLFPDMFGSGVPSLPTDYELAGSAESYMITTANVGLSHSLSRASSVSFGYTHGRSAPTESRGEQSYRGVQAGYDHELARGLSLRLGYARSVGQYPQATDGERTVQNQTIDAGVDFTRTLSFSRRTSLAFSTGSAIISDSGATRYDVVGSASLNHEIGRTWTADLSYTRQVDFLAVVREPAFSDSLSATLEGLIARRLSARASAGASRGTIGLSDITNRYRATQASAGIQVALARSVGLQLDYIYYRYRFDSGAFLPAALGTRLARHAVQASVSLWAPLFHRTRSANAAR